MKLKSIVLSLFVIVCIGMFFVGVTHAQLTFNSWQGAWFEVKQSETGKAAPIWLPGGDVEKNNEPTTKTYLNIIAWDLDTTTYTAAYCYPYQGVYTRQTVTEPEGVEPLTLKVLGGNPVDFLTFFSIAYQETASIVESLWIPLEVKGKDVAANPGEVKSGSFKALGGIFIEEGALAQGIGSVKFTGTFIHPDKVTDKVPDPCLP